MSRNAFTLIELLTVVAVMVALSAMLIAGMGVLSKRSRIQSTQLLVDTAASDLAAIQIRLISTDGGARFVGHFNAATDNIVDGHPADDPGFSESERTLAESLGYTGFRDAVGMTVKDQFVDFMTGRLVDAWRQPLRIDYSGDRYGSDGFGIWSVGPDGEEQSGVDSFDLEADDLRSWGTGR